MERQALARLKDVVVHFGSRRILDGVDLTIETGDFWTLIGPNGAGKSTLLGLFNGLTAYRQGRVEYKGRPVIGKTLSRVRHEVAHVFQGADIDPKMPLTVFESVMAGAYGRLGLLKRPGRRERALTLDALEAVGLSCLANRPIGHLSGGERQRMALARALVQEPDFLLLDEPTASLDWQAQREILNMVGELRNQYHLTVFMVTHDLNAVFSLAQHVAMLKDGKLIWSGPAAGAMDPELLSSLYGVPITIAAHENRRAVLF
jgi:manganese/iron transport system ATP-binding protein